MVVPSSLPLENLAMWQEEVAEKMGKLKDD
jgi:hypothetical protein